MATTKYNFKDARRFLNNSIGASDLYNKVCAAIGLVQDIEYDHDESEASQEIFSTLLMCADLLETMLPVTSKKAG